MGTNVELGERVEAYLNLIHLRRPNLRITPHFLNMRHPKIANPNTLRLPLVHQFLQRLPHLLYRLRTSTRRVYQEQIHIPTLPSPFNFLNTLGALLVRRPRRTSRRHYLSGKKDFGPFEAGLAKSPAHFNLVAIELRRVDVAVAGAEGVQAGFDGGLGVGLVDSEAEAGDFEGGIGERKEVCYGEFGGHV